MFSSYDQWKCTDPDLEYAPCPECDSPLKGDKWFVECTSDECDFEHGGDFSEASED